MASELSSLLNHPKEKGTGPSTVGTLSNGKEIFFPKCLAEAISCCFWFWFFIVSFGFVRGKGITSKNLQVLDCVPRSIFK